MRALLEELAGCELSKGEAKELSEVDFPEIETQLESDSLTLEIILSFASSIFHRDDDATRILQLSLNVESAWKFLEGKVSGAKLRFTDFASEDDSASDLADFIHAAMCFATGHPLAHTEGGRLRRWVNEKSVSDWEKDGVSLKFLKDAVLAVLIA